ncbi:glycosyltransferase family 2 protein [Plasticicumulans acidivorans]|uniref:Glycosyltransferase involved in cell wall biosynthesis n=1 Tax=Plasticicumulans acidivorans TaxID=886464 RepID=A0A317MQ94_9GAMM|nr:glycosyltransferase family 2 protein [Plasticicumulans acidivorans]PWV58718.1 glycosyltransferase involved in cell wall biosynthesis [Plasticicumulans acidivorans]
MPLQLGIVVPCYNEEAVLPETVQRLLALLDRLNAAQLISADSQLYFVDDGSRDATWKLIEQFAATDARVHGVKLSRNRGHQNALLAGLFSARGDALVSIDADLQDDVETIEQMVRKHLNGADIVYGVRSSRASDTAFKRSSAEAYYRLLELLGVEIVYNHADYRLLSRRALEALGGFNEVNLFLRGIIPLLGFQTATVEYIREERFAGESKYPLRRMLGLAIEGVTSFSVTPLRLITGLGLIICGFSLLMIIWIILGKLLTDSVVPGWASSVIPIYFLGGVQLLSIGVLGEYIAKIYLETKRRPRYFIEKTI